MLGVPTVINSLSPTFDCSTLDSSSLDCHCSGLTTPGSSVSLLLLSDRITQSSFGDEGSTIVSSESINDVLGRFLLGSPPNSFLCLCTYME